MIVSTAVSLFATSVVGFAALAAFTSMEQKRGQRFFATSLRGRLDEVVASTSFSLSRRFEHFSKYFLQLGWYYSLQSVLKALQVFFKQGYARVESGLERSRTQARALRQERQEIDSMNHLRQVAEHKAGTALSPAQKRRLRQKKLDEKH